MISYTAYRARGNVATFSRYLSSYIFAFQERIIRLGFLVGEYFSLMQVDAGSVGQQNSMPPFV